jgi:hypothetical protein
LRKAVEYRTASRENYQCFIDDHPEVKVSFTQWANIIYTFNYAFRDYMLETGSKARMPYGFGDFMVAKKKKKTYKTLPDGTERINLSIDWKKTREMGKHIYHTNRHTGGFNFYWRWENKNAKIYQKVIWYFKPSRITSRLITHYINQYPQSQYLYQQW